MLKKTGHLETVSINKWDALRVPLFFKLNSEDDFCVQT